MLILKCCDWVHGDIVLFLFCRGISLLTLIKLSVFKIWFTLYSCNCLLAKCGQHVNEYASIAIVLVYSEMQHLKDASVCHAG